MNGGHNQLFFGGGLNGPFPQRSGSGAGSGAISPRDNYASVRRENRELKLEVARMRMRLTDLEKDHVNMKQELVRSHPANKLFKSFTKKLSKLNAMFRINSIKPGSESRFPFPKRRRHSVSWLQNMCTFSELMYSIYVWCMQWWSLILNFQWIVFFVFWVMLAPWLICLVTKPWVDYAQLNY